MEADMPLPRVRSDVHDLTFEAGLDRIREELSIPSAFPAEVAEEADELAARGPLPTLDDDGRDDRRDLPMVTLDPPGSRDLDQAFAIEPLGSPGAGGAEGWRVWYAIADVAAFVVPGGAVDAEARERGTTLYLPDQRSPLHPPSLSEGAASLLPDVDRPALLWRLEVDGDGRLTSGRVRRAVVRSRAQLDYPAAQAAVESGTLADDDPLSLLRACGLDLVAAESARGGVSLPLAEQVVELDDSGEYALTWRSPLDVEAWNAQLSLLCGRAGANLMLQGGVGLLRTLPAFDHRAVKEVKRRARALGIAWPDGPLDDAYPAFVKSVDPDSAEGAALLNTAASVLRGASYVGFGPGVGEAPEGEAALHHAVAAPYAHVTAPLRRLGDRFAAEAALSVSSQVDPPEWVLEALGELPRTMDAANQRGAQVSRAVVDLAEAVVLSSRLGGRLDAVVVGEDGDRGSSLQVLDPPVRARVDDRLELGDSLQVTVEWADPVARRVGLVPG
jgi:exoribonuclease R